MVLLFKLTLNISRYPGPEWHQWGEGRGGQAR